MFINNSHDKPIFTDLQNYLNQNRYVFGLFFNFGIRTR